jgi:hypothetical protein
MRVSRGKSVAVLCVAVLGGFAMLAAARPNQEGKPAGLRVGIFDSRAVAIAWARSEAFKASLREKQTEHDEAKEAGDEARCEEIGTEMKVLQEELHKQGFSIWPVRNVLALIEDDIEEIANRAGVDVIVCKWDLAYRGPKVALTDVTHLMVEPFEPDAATLKILEEVKSQEPVSLEELDH